MEELEVLLFLNKSEHQLVELLLLLRLEGLLECLELLELLETGQPIDVIKQALELLELVWLQGQLELLEEIADGKSALLLLDTEVEGFELLEDLELLELEALLLLDESEH